jgi:hypothetical protein
LSVDKENGRGIRDCAAAAARVANAWFAETGRYQPVMDHVWLNLALVSELAAATHRPGIGIGIADLVQ